MKKILIGGLVGGLVFYIWQSFSWMMLPWHMPKNIPDPEPVVELLQERITEHWVYHFPSFPDEMNDKSLSKDDKKKVWDAVEARYKKGPRIMQMVYLPGGGPFMYSAQFVFGILINIVMATVAAYLLSLASGKLSGYGQRVIFVALVGLIASLSGPITNWNWWLYPAGFIVAVAVDMIIAWVLAGLVIAKIVKPE